METQTDYKQSNNYVTSTDYKQDNKIITCVSNCEEVITIDLSKLPIV